MDWSNERYTRLYTRDTKTWILIGWEGQCLFSLLLRKADRAGMIDDVRDADDISVILRNGMPVDSIAIGLDNLTRYGVVTICDAGMVIPNFIDAQESAQSDKQRGKSSRERRRDIAKRDHLSQNVTQKSQNVTEPSHPVTPGHTASQSVTPCLPSVPSVPSVPCRADPPVPGKSVKTDADTAAVTPRKKAKEKKVAKSRPTWEAYSRAYENRYGVPPVRNAKANSLCCGLVDDLGAEEAPLVASYYLSTNAQPYVGSTHCLDLLKRDCQKFRTEYLTGHRNSRKQANDADQLQGTGDGWRKLIEESREKERKEKENEK